MTTPRSGATSVGAIHARLLALHPKRIDLSLDRIERLLGALGHPERQLPPVIHVAGTNGKGSTIAFTRAILEAAQKRVHVYTSPNLVRLNERFRIGQAGGGKLVDDDALAAALADVTVTGGGTITVDSGQTLTLDGDTLNEVTLSGGTDAIGAAGVTVSGDSAIDNATVDGNDDTITVDSGVTLTLNGTDSITGGTLSNAGMLNADGSVTFDNMAVTNTGAGSIDVGTTTTATLTLDGDTTVTAAR